MHAVCAVLHAACARVLLTAPHHRLPAQQACFELMAVNGSSKLTIPAFCKALSLLKVELRSALPPRLLPVRVCLFRVRVVLLLLLLRLMLVIT